MRERKTEKEKSLSNLVTLQKLPFAVWMEETEKKEKRKRDIEIQIY